MAPELCGQHSEHAVRWHCATCGAPLCDQCGAGAFQSKVYCSRCLKNQQPVASEAQAPSDRGVGLGIGLSFFLLVLPSLVVGILAVAFQHSFVSAWIPWLGLISNPFVATGLAFFIAKRRGRQGLAKGLLIGLVIWIALTVLLVAACFGLVAVLSHTRR